MQRNHLKDTVFDFKTLIGPAQMLIKYFSMCVMCA